MKPCTKCKKVLPFTDFQKKGMRKDGTQKFQSHCKSCISSTRKENYSPEKRREKLLKERFGITIEEYNSLLEKQNHSCAICNTTNTSFSHGKHFHVDHCHTTGKVRGLLCGRCNVALGHVGDNIHTLTKMIEYLK